jgi:hypothetical protein
VRVVSVAGHVLAASGRIGTMTKPSPFSSKPRLSFNFPKTLNPTETLLQLRHLAKTQNSCSLETNSAAMAAPNPGAPSDQQLRNYKLRHYIRGEYNKLPNPIPENACNADPVPYKPPPWPGVNPQDFMSRAPRSLRPRRRATGRRLRLTRDIANTNFNLAPAGSRRRRAYQRVRRVLGPGPPWPHLRFVKILGWGGLGVVALVQYYDWGNQAGNHYVLKAVLDPNAPLAIQNLSEEKRRMRVSG